jgi:hypothetical protein
VTTLRTLYMPLRPDLDEFLFATVGEERDGMPLSVISALTGLGLDPWVEATRLLSLQKGEAVKQLVLTIARLPGERWASSEIRKIASGLIERLPSASGAGIAAIIKRPAGAQTAPSKMFWLVCFLVTAAALVSMAANGGFPFNSHHELAPVSQTESPVRSD